MFNTSNGYSLSDIAAATGNGNGGMWGEGSWFIWIILIFAIFGGWGNNGWGGNQGSTSVYEGYVLNNDFSVLSNQMSQGFASQERKLDSISNGICSLGYDQLAQMNNLGTSILTTGNTLQAAIKDCCCQTQQNLKDVSYNVGAQAADLGRALERGFADANYNLASQANGLQTSIANGFCQTNFNAQTNTRDIVDSQNAGTQAILARIDALESSRKDERIAELTSQVNALNLAASQQAQNSYLVDKLGIKPPVAAFSVPAPWQYTNCGCNSGCGC